MPNPRFILFPFCRHVWSTRVTLIAPNQPQKQKQGLVQVVVLINIIFPEDLAIMVHLIPEIVKKKH